MAYDKKKIPKTAKLYNLKDTGDFWNLGKTHLPVGGLDKGGNLTLVGIIKKNGSA